LLPDDQHCESILAQIQQVDLLSRIELTFPATPELLFNVDALSPHVGSGSTSKLAHIKLHGLRVTRNSFSRLLQICPALESLDMCRTVVESSVTTDIREHRRLHQLVALIDHVFLPDLNYKEAPPLLQHFPNLAQWETWQGSNVLDTHCPRKIRLSFSSQHTCLRIQEPDGDHTAIATAYHGHPYAQEHSQDSHDHFVKPKDLPVRPELEHLFHSITMSSTCQVQFAFPRAVDQRHREL